MYYVLVTLEQLAVSTLQDIASAHDVVFAHHESLDGNVKLLMADNEDVLCLVINKALSSMGISVRVTGFVEGHPFYITM